MPPLRTDANAVAASREGGKLRSGNPSPDALGVFCIDFRKLKHYNSLRVAKCLVKDT